MILIFTLSILMNSTVSAAVVLQPLPTPQTDRLPIDTNGPNYTCAEVLQKLQDYQNMSNNHNQSVSGFLSQVIDKMNGWYAQLAPLEGTQQGIARGTFKPLQDGAQQISSVTDMAYDNASLLASEMDKIITSLQPCLKK